MPVAGLDPARHLLVIGVSQHTANSAVRDRLFAAEADPARLLAVARSAGVLEVMVLATCERVELIAVDPDPTAATDRLTRELAGMAGVDAEEMRQQARGRQGREALRHVFAVAASLESQLLGEPQILGQVKACHRRAADGGTIGPVLESVMQAAYVAAKRVRTETPVAERPVSIAASAVQVARDIHGDLTRCRGLLIGLGEAGEFLAGEFENAGLRGLVVTHASLARAEAAAHRLDCHFRPWAELDDALAGADIIISAVGAGYFTVTSHSASAALRRRRQEAMFFIDGAVPGDIDPGVTELDGAFVYGLDDLERVALSGIATREAAAEAAWGVLEEEVNGFLRQRAERSAVPAVVALRRHFEAARAEVLVNRSLTAEEATRRLVNRLLHDPSEALRAAAGEGAEGSGPGPAALEEALGCLYRIGAGETGEPRTGGAPEEGDEP